MVSGTGNQTVLINTNTSGNPKLILSAAGYSTGFIQYARSGGGLLQLSGDGTNVAMSIDSSSRVGIGTTSPGVKFTVVGSPGDLAAFSNATDASLVISANSGVAKLTNDAASGSIAFGTGSSGTERARIDSSGRLLVGTSTTLPNSNNELFQVAGGSGTGIGLSRFTADANGPGYSFYKSRNGTTGSFTIVQTDDVLGDFYFFGSTSSNYQAAARIHAAIDSGTVSASSMPGRLVFSTTADGASSPTTRVTILSSGAMLVPYIYATTSASAANVIVGSDGNLFRSTSSARYKTNVETLQNNYADAILDCRPVWYRSISKIDNPDHGFWGFIAEEVAEIDPRLVFWKTSESVVQEDGSRVDVPLETPEPEGVQYDRFVPHLLNLIKRQGEAIADLQAEVSALKGA